MVGAKVCRIVKAAKKTFTVTSLQIHSENIFPSLLAFWYKLLGCMLAEVQNS